MACIGTSVSVLNLNCQSYFLPIWILLSLLGTLETIKKEEEYLINALEKRYISYQPAFFFNLGDGIVSVTYICDLK